jgi:hypothetical protein
MKNKKTTISIVIATFLVFFGVTFFVANKIDEKQNISSVEKLPPPSLPLIKGEEKGGGQSIETVLEINGVKYEDEIAGKTSIYDFMSKLQAEGKIKFTEKNYVGMGEFIVSINGVANNQKQSWIYYVNGKEASIGISNYKINGGDVVSWKYEQSNY